MIKYKICLLILKNVQMETDAWNLSFWNTEIIVIRIEFRQKRRGRYFLAVFFTD